MKLQLHCLPFLLAVLVPSAPAAPGAVDPAFSAGISRIAFGSCAGQDQPQPIWEAVLAQDPQLWIWAGDNIYGDTEDMELFYTFGIRGLRSRLDTITYSDNSLEVVNAFVLDTAILDLEVLDAMGLEPADSAATDHLPVVVDLLRLP